MTSLVFLSVLFMADIGGRTGRTLKSGSTGCSCHTKSTAVVVKINGPDTLQPGAVGNYTVTMTGGPTAGCGVDIAASAGTLAANDTYLKLSGGELTQSSVKPLASGIGTFSFKYTAPATVGSALLYSTGIQVNNTGGSGGDAWNFSPNKTVTVAAAIQPNCKSIALVTDWNIVAAPVNVANPLISATFTQATSQAYSFNNGYIAIDTMNVGKAFWLRYPQAASFNLCGSLAANTTVPVNAGWNLVGIQMADVATTAITSTPAGIVNSFFYGFENGYTTATTLASGKGYWIQVTQNGTLNLGVVAKAGTASVPKVSESWTKLILTDGNGMTSTLYTSKSPVEQGAFSLPPLPPNGVFDARFSSQQNVEFLGGSAKQIEFNSAAYPVEIRADGTELIISDAATAGKLLRQTLRNGEKIIISNTAINKIYVQSVEKSVTFKLLQNYPNPFNPTTTISYQLPVASLISLKVYNGLSQEVASIVSGVQDAGNHSVEFDASKLSSGIYFYKLSAGNFVETRKLLLIK